MTNQKNPYKPVVCLCILFHFVAVSNLWADDNDPVNQASEAAKRLKLDYFYYEGIRLKHAGEYDSSYEMFKRCIEIDSTSSAALYEISSYFDQLNKPESAVTLLKKAVEYAPDNQEYRNALATMLFKLGMFGEAAEEYEVLAALHPEKLELIYSLAVSYARMGEIDKAIEAYAMLENNLGMHEVISMEKFRLYMQIEQQDSAFNELIRLSEKYPLDTRYPVIIGDLYLELNDKEQALKYYNQAYQTDSMSPYYFISMANYYEQTGDQDAARQQIQNALANEKLDIDTKLGILSRYIMQLQRTKQDYESAYALFQTLIEQHPNEPELMLIFGRFLIELKKFDEARFQFQLVTETEPENLDAWQMLLELLYQQQETDEIIRICQKWQEIMPDAMIFRYFLGMVYFQQKKYIEAAQVYQEGLPFIPKDNLGLISNFHGLLGDVYFRLKDTEKAFESYEKALQYNDKNIVVLNNYAYYLSLMKKDLSKAERMSALTLKMDPDNPTYIDTYAWIYYIQGNYLLAKLYIEQAISKNRDNSAELFDHYGDILFKTGDIDKAVEQWQKAKEAGKKSATLNKKIEEKTYFEETEDEVFNDSE